MYKRGFLKMLKVYRVDNFFSTHWDAVENISANFQRAPSDFKVRPPFHAKF